jgi:hypothetical protein
MAKNQDDRMTAFVLGRATRSNRSSRRRGSIPTPAPTTNEGTITVRWEVSRRSRLSENEKPLDSPLSRKRRIVGSTQGFSLFRLKPSSARDRFRHNLVFDIQEVD